MMMVVLSIDEKLVEVLYSQVAWVVVAIFQEVDKQIKVGYGHTEHDDRNAAV